MHFAVFHCKNSLLDYLILWSFNRELFNCVSFRKIWRLSASHHVFVLIEYLENRISLGNMHQTSKCIMCWRSLLPYSRFLVLLLFIWCFHNDQQVYSYVLSIDHFYRASNFLFHVCLFDAFIATRFHPICLHACRSTVCLCFIEPIKHFFNKFCILSQFYNIQSYTRAYVISIYTSYV